MLILLEGIDGVGKTTLARQIRFDLLKQGVVSSIKREPTGLFRELINSKQYAELTNLFLFLSSRAEMVRLMKSNNQAITILDRFSPSTLVYQAQFFDLEFLYNLDKKVRDGLKPDFCFLLKADALTIRNRLYEKGESISDLELETLMKLQENYTKAFERLDWQFVEINTSKKSYESVAKEVLGHVQILQT